MAGLGLSTTLPELALPALPMKGPEPNLPRRSTAGVQVPAQPEAVQEALRAPTRRALRERRALRSLACPTPERRARSNLASASTPAARLGFPMTARQWAVARLRREKVLPSRSRRVLPEPQRRAWERPKPEWAGSTTAPPASAIPVPQAWEPEAHPQPALPMRGTGRRAEARAAQRVKAPAHPTLARPLQAAMPAQGPPSSEPALPGRPGIPTSAEVRELRPELAAEPPQRASPTSVRELPAARRVRPRRAL
jgi:hypothetical protein